MSSALSAQPSAKAKELNNPQIGTVSERRPGFTARAPAVESGNCTAYRLVFVLCSEGAELLGGFSAPTGQALIRLLRWQCRPSPAQTLHLRPPKVTPSREALWFCTLMFPRPNCVCLGKASPQAPQLSSRAAVQTLGVHSAE